MTQIRIESDNIKKLNATVYVNQDEKPKEFVDAMVKGNGKSIIWEILKQVRPGMSLDRVTLPTHVMEPRSLTEKMTDYFSHVNYLNEAANEPTPSKRFVKLVQFFLSGFYVMPEACKKPYNPMWGEFYRTMWQHEDGSKTFLVLEQTSHHPPITSLYCQNRQAGWVGSANLDFATSFNGINASAGIRGEVKVKMLKYDEEYVWNFPTCLVSGIFIPPLTMEMSGVLKMKCEKTKMNATIDFKTQSMWSAYDFRRVEGHIYDENGKCIYDITGKYDDELFLDDKINGKKESFFKVSELKKNKVPRLVREKEKLHPFESEKLFKRVSEAIVSNDQNRAMDEKFVLEEAQRVERRRKEFVKEEHVNRLFDYIGPHNYEYKWSNWEKYDAEKEGEEVEVGGKLVTLKKDEVLSEERIQEILKDVPYPEWKDGEEPPHMIESFKFLLKRDMEGEDSSLEKELKDVKEARKQIEEKLSKK